jgi:hypothetical protein
VFPGQSVPGTRRVYMFEIACGRRLGLGKKNFGKDVTEVRRKFVSALRMVMWLKRPEEIGERITYGFVVEKALFRERRRRSHGVFIL